MDPDLEEWEAANAGSSGGDSDLAEWEASQVAPEPQQDFSLGQQVQDAIGGSAKGYLSGFGKALAFPIDLAATGVADLAASLDAGEFTHVPGKGLADYFDEGLDDLVGNVEGDSAAGRIAERGGELAGSVGGFGGAAKYAAPGKVANFFNANGLRQLLLGEAGGLAGGTVKEAGGSENQQLAAELATMVGPDLLKGGLKLGKYGASKLGAALSPAYDATLGRVITPVRQKFYQTAQEASDEVMDLVKKSSDNPLTNNYGEEAAQLGRNKRLAALVGDKTDEGIRYQQGLQVQAAKDALAIESPEIAGAMRTRSDLLKQAKRAPLTPEDRALLTQAEKTIASVPESDITVKEGFPLVNEKFGNFFKGTEATATKEPNKVFEAIKTLKSENAEFSEMANDLQRVFGIGKWSGKGVSTDDYEEVASRVGKRLLDKEGANAEAFVSVMGEHPEALSLGRAAALKQVFGGTPTSWIRRVNENRGALTKLFSPKVTAGIEAVADKNKSLVGGYMAAGMVRFFGNKGPLLAGVASAATPLGFIPGAIIGKVMKTVADKPLEMQKLISRAFQNDTAAALLSKEATAENVKAAVEYFKSAGRSAIMGVAADDDENEAGTDLGIVGLSNEINPTRNDTAQKKSEVIRPTAADADLTPKPTPIPEKLLKAVIWQESKGDPKAVGPMTKYGTAKGKMQIIDTTFKEWAKKLGIKNPDVFNEDHNQRVGTAYLSHLLDQSDGDVRLALAKYNYGMGNVAKLQAKYGDRFEDIRSALPKETKEYVTNIVKKTGQVEA